MSEAGLSAAPLRRGTNRGGYAPRIRPSTALGGAWGRLGALGGAWRVSGAVAAVGVVGLDPLLGDDRRVERELAAQDRRRDDLGELADLAVAVATEHLQALALRGQAGAAAVGGHDERGAGD